MTVAAVHSIASVAAANAANITVTATVVAIFVTGGTVVCG